MFEDHIIILWNYFDTVTIWQIVCHEATWEMRARPLGAGLQEQAPNHLNLRWLRARAVSVKEKHGKDHVR